MSDIPEAVRAMLPPVSHADNRWLAVEFRGLLLLASPEHEPRAAKFEDGEWHVDRLVYELPEVLADPTLLG